MGFDLTDKHYCDIKTAETLCDIRNVMIIERILDKEGKLTDEKVECG